MANELYTRAPTGSFVWAIAYVGRQPYAGMTPEAWNDTHFATYVIAMSENGTSGDFFGNSPSANATSYVAFTSASNTAPILSEFQSNVIWEDVFPMSGGGGAAADVTITEQDFAISDTTSSNRFGFKIEVPAPGGTLTDADITPTIGIIRTDTNAIVVAAGTLMTRDSMGEYSYTLSSPISGVTYRATYTVTIDGALRSWSRDKTIPFISWYYATQTDVEDAIGVEALAIDSNQENETIVADTARIQRAGLWSDAIINTRLAALGYVTPVATLSDDDAQLLGEISVCLVVGNLNEWRALQVPDRGQTRIDRLASDYIKRANSLFTSIAFGAVKLDAARISGYDDAATAITGRLNDNTINWTTLNYPSNQACGIWP